MSDDFREACRSGDIEQIKAAINSPWSMNWKNSFVWTCESGNIAAVKWILAEGLGKWNGYPDIDAGLGTACYNKHHKLAKYLVELGAQECKNCFCIENH